MDIGFWIRWRNTQEYTFWIIWASEVARVVKNLPVSAGDVRGADSIPGLERSPGEGNGNSLQYSYLENPMDGEAWRATIHRVARRQTRLSAHTRTLTYSILFTFLFLSEFHFGRFSCPFSKFRFFPLLPYSSWWAHWRHSSSLLPWVLFPVFPFDWFLEFPSLCWHYPSVFCWHYPCAIYLFHQSLCVLVTIVLNPPSENSNICVISETCSDGCSVFSGCVFFLLLGGEGMATHSSILAWRVPWTVYPRGYKESDTTEQLFTSLADATTWRLLCQPTPAWDLLPTFWEVQPRSWPNTGLTGLIFPSGKPENKQIKKLLPLLLWGECLTSLLLSPTNSKGIRVSTQKSSFIKTESKFK